MAGRKKTAEPKFEKDLEQLEKIVEELEEGGLSLDVSLKKFEEGIKLAQRCEKALSDAEKKIDVLTKNAEGELEAKPFAGEEEEEAEAAEDAEDDASDAEEDEDEDDAEMLF